MSLPGGCAIGTRPVDLHLKGLRAPRRHGRAAARAISTRRAEQGLTGAEIVFPVVSVGATENLMMAATLAHGETVLVNAAREPEIVDLARCLVAMGAEIEGAGTDRVRIRGVKRLTRRAATGHPRPHRDRHLHDGGGDHRRRGRVSTGARLRAPSPPWRALLEGAGVEVSETPHGLIVRRRNARIAGVDVMTEPFPGFPTDLQAQMMALMTIAEGAAMITETIFENRFMHVPELCRMGANINVHGASAMVRGVPQLAGAPVMATDLRASVSLVLAGLAAEGETMVNRVYHLDRGYERLEEKLAACGAEIERLVGDG